MTRKIPIPDLSMRQIRTFLAVVESGGVSSAARALNVTQPAVSKVLRVLEEAVGSKLFEKQGLRLNLTAAGTVFLRHAQAAIAEFQAGMIELDALTSSRAELLRVAAIPSLLSSCMPRVVARLLATRPNVRVVLSGDAWFGVADIIPALVRGDIDLGLIAYQEELAQGAVIGRELYAESLSLVARRDHPLAARERITIADIMDEIVALPPLESLAGQILIQEFTDVGLPFPKRRVTALNRQLLFGLVRECNALAFVTTHPVCAEDVGEENIRLPVTFRRPVPWKISLCQRRSSQPSDAMIDFIEHLEALIAESVAADLPHTETV